MYSKQIKTIKANQGSDSQDASGIDRFVPLTFN